MPLKFIMAQMIARKILENRKLFDAKIITNAEMFVSPHWIGSWRLNMAEWETSIYWLAIAERMPEILEKIGWTTTALMK